VKTYEQGFAEGYKHGWQFTLIAALIPVMLFGFICYQIGVDSEMRYGKCTKIIKETRYICTNHTSHGACTSHGLREVPLCVEWER